MHSPQETPGSINFLPGRLGTPGGADDTDTARFRPVGDAASGPRVSVPVPHELSGKKRP